MSNTVTREERRRFATVPREARFCALALLDLLPHGIGAVDLACLTRHTGLTPPAVERAVELLEAAAFLISDGDLRWLRIAPLLDPLSAPRTRGHRVAVCAHLRALGDLPLVAAFARYHGLDHVDDHVHDRDVDGEDRGTTGLLNFGAA